MIFVLFGKTRIDCDRFAIHPFTTKASAVIVYGGKTTVVAGTSGSSPSLLQRALEA
jgi:hypothetical protein